VIRQSRVGDSVLVSDNDMILICQCQWQCQTLICRSRVGDSVLVSVAVPGSDTSELCR
jgi:hypothetical protein